MSRHTFAETAQSQPLKISAAEFSKAVMDKHSTYYSKEKYSPVVITFDAKQDYKLTFYFNDDELMRIELFYDAQNNGSIMFGTLSFSTKSTKSSGSDFAVLFHSIYCAFNPAASEQDSSAFLFSLLQDENEIKIKELNGILYMFRTDNDVMSVDFIRADLKDAILQKSAK